MNTASVAADRDGDEADGARFHLDREKVGMELEALVRVAHALSRAGLTPATSSNFSIRSSRQTFLVTESGWDKGRIGAYHFLEVDLAGKPVPGEQRRPSAETLLHAVVYERHPSVGAVLHTHSRAATLLSRLALDPTASSGSLRIAGWELLKALAGTKTHDTHVDLQIFANSQDMDALGAEVRRWLDAEAQAGRTPWAFLIAGHGIYAWGQRVADAERHLEAFEYLLSCELELRKLGAASR